MKNLNITFEDKAFKKLKNAKEEAIILGFAKNWEDYILMLARIPPTKILDTDNHKEIMKLKKMIARVKQ